LSNLRIRLNYLEPRLLYLGDVLPEPSSSMTVVVVAHRLSTVRNADVICVVEKGRVIESGNHVDLLKNESGAYSNLIRRQMNAQNKLDGKAENKSNFL